MILFAGIFSFAAPFAFRYISDFCAMQVVLLGCAALWNERENATLTKLAGCAAVALGVLLKPTAVIALAVLLLHPRPIRAVLRNVLPLAVALALGLAYYTRGMVYIGQFRELEPLFAVQFREPWQAILQFAGDPVQLLQLINFNAFFPYGLVLVILATVCPLAPGVRRDLVPLALLLALQVLTIGVLDGIHAFQHTYYFLSCAPIAACIYLLLWEHTRVRFFKVLFAALLIVRTLELAGQDARGWWDDNTAFTLFAECEALREQQAQLPWGQGQVFRASVEDYPLLGLCFGERQGSEIAPYGFFYKQGPLPPGCQPLASSQHLVLATCTP
ncbi:MAG: hypothetical protein HYW48_07505 [Deltaproteobacteria bacterium]|nr:hypothetical protein [Deltaproteobacteria bacterium]